MRICDNCARAKEDKSRDLFPIRCTKNECWVEYYYSCKDWVGREDDGYITDVERKMETVVNDCTHKDCRYRVYVSFLGESCLYMYYTGKRRGCDISRCNRYLPGTIEKIQTLKGMIYRGADDDL